MVFTLNTNHAMMNTKSLTKERRPCPVVRHRNRAYGIHLIHQGDPL